MTDTMLFHIAKNIIAVFLLSLGITPSEGEDSLTVRDVGPHRIFTQQAKAPPELARSLDAGDVLEQLVNYLEHHNALPSQPPQEAEGRHNADFRRVGKMR